MKKIILFIAFFCGSLQLTYGQAIIALLFGNKIQNDNISLGIHLGVQSSNITNSGDSKYEAGFAFGAYTNVKLKGKWTLSNYFIFKSPRGAKDIPLQYQLQDSAQYPAGSSLKRKLTYMEISPLIRYNLSPSWSVALGPQVAIKTVAKDIYNLDLDYDGQSKIQYKVQKKLARFDIDAAADLQYAFLKGDGLKLNLRYSQGLTNIYKKEVPFTANNQYFQLGVGIPIGGKKKVQAQTEKSNQK